MKVNILSSCTCVLYNSTYRDTPPARAFYDDVIAVTVFVRHVLRLKQFMTFRVHVFLLVRIVGGRSQLEFLKRDNKC